MAKTTKKTATERAREEAAKLGVPFRVKPTRNGSGEIIVRAGSPRK